MPKFAFLGTRSNVGDQQLVAFGQSIDLADDAVEDVVIGCPVIPQEDFDGLFAFLKPGELARFASAVSHTRAPQAFLEAKGKALVLYHEQRTDRIAARKANAAPETPSGLLVGHGNAPLDEPV